MRISQDGLSFVTKEEGFIPHQYLDPVGYPTIGVGHLLRPEELSSGTVTINGVRVDYSDGLTEAQVVQLLRQDLAWSERCVSDSVTVTLSQQQFDALVSFVFNVGCANFARSTLLRLLNLGSYNAVPSQLARWVYANKIKLPGLVARRRREGELFQDGTY